MKEKEMDYDFPTKRSYRRCIWSEFKRSFGGQVACRSTALLPSISGDEIDVALSKGFRQENMHIIDFNPAVVAVLKRRYPKINTYGVSVDRALERMVKSKTKLDAINLDFCSNMTADLCATLGYLSYSRIMTNQSVVAVSLLRGRELNGVRDALQCCGEDVSDWNKDMEKRFGASFLPTDAGRILLTGKALLGSSPTGEPDLPQVMRPYPVRIGKYKSTAGSQTMLWQIYSLHYVECTCLYCMRYGREFDEVMNNEITAKY